MIRADAAGGDDDGEVDLAGRRGRLFAVAYRLLGSVADAEDVVQDVAEVWTRTDRDAIDDPQAWLVTVTTRRCLDRLRSARHRRERYVGPWLPEPLVTEGPSTGADPATEAELADEVSFALLVVLDELSPAERVAFVLRDVFGERYERIAEVVDRSPEAVRQLASRARRRVQDATPPPPADRAEGRRLADAFFAASRHGDLDALLGMLAPDVVLVSDGGGVVTAARRPIHGADRVGRFVLGLTSRAGDTAVVEPVTVNGSPGARLWWDGQLFGVVVLDVTEGRVSTISLVVNPDKLRHLTGP